MHSYSPVLVNLKKFAPHILESVQYATSENFLGRVVAGYKKMHSVRCTQEAAQALHEVSEFLLRQPTPYRLVVYDGYRPQEAVEDFWRWSQDNDEVSQKNVYYPEIDKQHLFDLGYIAKYSTHTQGNTFDLTLINAERKQSQPQKKHTTLTSGFEMIYLDDGTLNMGTHFDFFGEASHHNSLYINATHQEHRHILRSAMAQFNFEEYKKEWWHYSYR